MKTYVVKINLSHESFGGYTHRDGEKLCEVQARNCESAVNKALKIVRKESPSYDADVVSCFEKGRYE